MENLQTHPTAHGAFVLKAAGSVSHPLVAKIHSAFSYLLSFYPSKENSSQLHRFSSSAFHFIANWVGGCGQDQRPSPHCLEPKWPPSGEGHCLAAKLLHCIHLFCLDDNDSFQLGSKWKTSKPTPQLTALLF